MLLRQTLDPLIVLVVKIYVPKATNHLPLKPLLRKAVEIANLLVERIVRRTSACGNVERR